MSTSVSALAIDNEPRLYLVHLGGELAPGRDGEDHEVVVVVAADLKGARSTARARWGGVAPAHVDAVQVLSAADGFAVHLVSTQSSTLNPIDLTCVPAEDFVPDSTG